MNDTDLNVVIYARYSSEKQREASIDVQVEQCEKYADANGLTVTNKYIDRAISGQIENRPQFIQMTKDSIKDDFQAVLVYKYDRFSRDDNVARIYENELNKNNVILISVTEPIDNNPLGRFQKSVLYANNQLFVEVLRERVSEGMQKNIENGLYNGGPVAFGYKIENSRYVIDEETAPIVKQIFQDYANNRPIFEIIGELNKKGFRTYKGKEFNQNSFNTILNNKKYIGIYGKNEETSANTIPRIIDDELFESVQKRKIRNKRNSAATGDYILTGLLFCGNCAKQMVGKSGTSKTGALHYYYACHGKLRKKTKCNKKNIKQGLIETAVINKCKEMLTDDNINKIVKSVEKVQKNENERPMIHYLQKREQEINNKINNIVNAISSGVATESLPKELQRLEEEQKEVQQSIQDEKLLCDEIDTKYVEQFLYGLRNITSNDRDAERKLIDIFVEKIFLYDDKIIMLLNPTEKKQAIDISLHKVSMESSHTKSKGVPRHMIRTS